METILEKVKRKLHRRIARRMRSANASLSDNQAYPQVCLDASRSYKRFNRFRRHPIYTQILEHVSAEHGRQFLELFKDDVDLMSHLEEFKMNDSYGNPRVATYPEVGTISPTTLRYIKVLSDLKQQFHSLDNLNICEIGVGYGGQCRIIDAYYRPATYRLIDLQPVLALTQRYLDHFVMHATIDYRTMNELQSETYDLAISNYAFTELPRSVQDVYLERVLLKAKRGFIMYNQITPPEFNSYRANELVAMFPDAQIIVERPRTSPNNCLIVWGDVGA